MRPIKYLSFILTISIIFFVFLSPSILAQENNQKDTSELATNITNLQAEIDSLGKELSELNAKSNELTQRIQQNEASLQSKAVELEMSKNNMGGRVRTMYIYGNDSFISIIFSSESVRDFIENSQNVYNIVKMDADSIKAIQTEQKELSDQITQLVKDKESIEATKTEIAAKRNELQEKTKQQEGNLTTYGSTKTTTGNATSPAGDRDFICAVVASEGNSSYDSALAVISCVMNRCDTGAWGGKDPISVLTAPGQFSGYLDGPYTRFLNHGYPAHVEQAVSDCLDKGICNHKCLGFRNYPGWSGGTEINIGGNYYGNSME
ncbi:MAG: cell wall hydrolase [Eubacteriaceae bacterium]|nr:cell wall hydrolase [Eubacteriaceae bacterium]